MGMKRYAGGFGLMAMLVAGVASAAWAQEVEPIKPRPAPANTTPPPRPKQPPLAASTAAPPLPTAEQLCATGGGDWRNGQCDLSKPTCLASGKLWDEPTRECRPKAEPLTATPAPTPPPQDTAAEPTGPVPAPAPAPQSGGGSGGLRTAALIGGGVLLGASAFTGALAFSKKSSWSDQCDGKACYAAAQDDYDAGKRYGNISTGTFIAGALFLSAGLFLIPGSDPGPEADSASVKPSVDVAAGHGGGFVSARWRY